MKARRAVFLPLLLLAGATLPPGVSAAPRWDPNAPCFRWPAVDYDGDGVFDRIDRCNNTPAGCAVDEFGCTIDSDRDGVCEGVDICPGSARGAGVDEHGCASGQRAARPTAEPPREVSGPASAMSESERQLVEHGRIRLENIYFGSDNAELLPESETSLREAGAALEKFPDLRIEVQGHSDTRGQKAHNLRLSQDRAASVRRWLLAHFVLRPGNLIAHGYGETRPDTRERNEDERMHNRRVELVVLNPGVLPRGVKVENKE